MTSIARRTFLVNTGLGLATGSLLSGTACRTTGAGAEDAPQPAAAGTPAATTRVDDWNAVRSQFPLSREHIHMALLFLTSHPTPVRDAIERYRRALDENPVDYFHDNDERLTGETLAAAAEYLGAVPAEIALTESTTMSLGLLYGGLKLREGEDIVTTEHDHYSTHESVRLRAARMGATFRKIPLYKRIESVSEGEIVESIARAAGPKTRAVAVTWMHSATGLKLPIRRIADALVKINASRDEADKVLLCVDGVHAFGVENATVGELGCDFLAAGCHKWMFGPRGTGILWGKAQAWKRVDGTIPPFNKAGYGAWMEGGIPTDRDGSMISPGGFKPFEHRWALAEAFRFHQRIGKARITARIHELNRQAKEGLLAMRHVKLVTPMDEKLSGGIICFEVKGLDAKQVVERLRARKVIASVTPYATKYPRLSPGVLNSTEEVDTVLREIRSLA